MRRTCRPVPSHAIALSSVLATALCAALSGCGGSSSGGTTTPPPPPPPQTYSIGGSLSGLSSGASLTLLDGGADALKVTANGPFTFATDLASGAAYAVTVGTQPAGETCTVSNGSGTVGTAIVTTVSVSCMALAPATYTIGGTVSGLPSSTSLTLLDNGADSLTVTANGPFTFKTPLKSGTAYAVTVGTAPAGETCTVTSGSGTVASANITGVQVNCTPTVTAGESLLYSFGAFGGPDGAYPDSMIQARDGNFYGVTESGGANSTGAVFELTPAGSESIIYSMNAQVVNGVVETADPVSLIEATDGTLWGVAHNGGVDGVGGVFEVSGGTGSLVYSFIPSLSDGSYPTGLIQASDGNFYGTTTNGGAHAVGTLFRITPAGTETVLYSFGAMGDAASPIGSLVQGSDGAFYGVSTGGGSNSTGAVFRITAGGTETVLYSFGPQSGTDGRSASGGLIQASDGNFYGLTNAGGANGTGVVYQVTPAGAETVVYSFPPPINAANPRPVGPLLQGTDGNFYGTTQAGGVLNVGAIFELTPAGVETTLHSFIAQGTDVAGPLDGVLLGTDGNLYGTGSAGGAHSTGGVFRLTL